MCLSSITIKFPLENMEMILFGDKASINDIRNYFSCHIADHSVSLSAIIQRVSINNMRIYIRQKKRSIVHLFPYLYVRYRLKQVSVLLNKTEYKALLSITAQIDCGTMTGTTNHDNFDKYLTIIVHLCAA